MFIKLSPLKRYFHNLFMSDACLGYNLLSTILRLKAGTNVNTTYLKEL